MSSGQNPFADNPNPYGGPQNPYASPQGPGQSYPSGTVKNYLVEAIICLVCCNVIFAIPAIIYAAQVDGKLAAGDYQGAVEYSNKAKTWCIVAVCVGVVCGGLSVVFQIAVMSAGM